jgi:hypothetical protein
MEIIRTGEARAGLAAAATANKRLNVSARMDFPLEGDDIRPIPVTDI